MSNDPKPRDIKPASSAEELNGMPEFAKAIRHLAHVPKAVVDRRIANEKSKNREKRG
jgi:hypothetical protein